MKELLLSILPVLRPLLETIITILGPVLVTWVTVRIVSLLKINDEQKKIEVEAKIRDSLHEAARNALLFAMTKYGVQGNSSTVLSKTIMQLVRQSSASDGVDDEARRLATTKLDSIIATAVNDYLVPKMPDAISKLKVTADGLADIVLSKAPVV